MLDTWAQVADKEAGANCPAALVHAARTRSRLGGKVKRRFQEGAVDEVWKMVYEIEQRTKQGTHRMKHLTCAYGNGGSQTGQPWVPASRVCVGWHISLTDVLPGRDCLSVYYGHAAASRQLLASCCPLSHRKCCFIMASIGLLDQDMFASRA